MRGVSFGPAVRLTRPYRARPDPEAETAKLTIYDPRNPAVPWLPAAQVGDDYEDIEYARSWARTPGPAETIGTLQAATAAPATCAAQALAAPLESPLNPAAVKASGSRRRVKRAHPWKTF